MSTLLSTVSRNIWVTFSFVGYHRYPDAPEEVAYLRDTHRHVFHFKVGTSVEHNDREIEFHMFKNWCVDQFPLERGPTGNLRHANLDYKSCEMLAEELINALVTRYGNRRTYSVEVSEDGECGAVVSWNPMHTWSKTKWTE